METAYLISHILLDNNARAGAFGANSYLVIKNHPEVAVKTGTTNDYRDAWTIGYTPSRLAAVWVGNNDNTQMRAGTAGAIGAAPAWNEIMSTALKEKEQEWHLKPDGIVGAHICNLSGLSPNPAAACETRFEYFIEGTIPAQVENLRQNVEIDKTVGWVADSKTPPENKEMQEHSVVYDLLNIPYCLDCAVATQSANIQYPLLGNSTTKDQN
jgi:membrane carboxypeptidase/penicillin-binding protein